MRKISSVTALCGLAALALLMLTIPAQAFDFSADMVTTSGGQTLSGKMYVSGEKSRTEMADSVIITRLDQNVTRVILTAQKMYMEQPIDRSKFPVASEKFEGEAERVSMGKEEVDGQPAERFKVTYTQNGTTLVAYQWVLDSNGFPVKMQAEDRSWSVEYKNVSLGAQPDDLFEVPIGYQKMDMPAGPSIEEMMKQAGQR
jgi:hypothetical protein